MRKVIISSVLSFLLLMSSCDAVTGLSSEPIRFKKETAKNGLILGSLTFPVEKAKYNGYQIFLTYISEDKKIQRQNSKMIYIRPEDVWVSKHKGQLNNGLTYLFSEELTEGTYKISQIGLFTNSGMAALQRTNYLGGFSLTFNVKKGEISYIGNLFLNERSKSKEITEVLKFENNFERDTKEVQKLQPSVDWTNTINNQELKIIYSTNE